MPATNLGQALALEDRLIQQETHQKRCIERFWSWWKTEREALEASIEENSAGQRSEEISREIHQIDPDLVWSMGAARGRRYELIVSSEGDPTLQLVAENWLAAAPRTCETWLFRTSTAPESCEGIELRMSGVSVAFDQISLLVEMDCTAELLHIFSYHPSFERLTEDQRSSVTYVYLSRLLGETQLTRWIGEISPLESPPKPDQGFSGGQEMFRNGAQLVDAVESLASQATGERFVVLRGGSTDEPLIGSMNAALKRIDHSEMVWNLEIDVHLESNNALGLPTSEEEEELSRMEEDLLVRLGQSAVLVGSITGLGRRNIHLYIAQVRDIEPHLVAWQDVFRTWKLEWRYSYDPAWDIQSREF